MTFDLGKCGLCERAVVYEVGKRPLCPECGERIGELYTKVRSLLRDYAERRMSVSEVARILEVDEREISYLVENGHFQLAEEWCPKEERERFI